LSERQVDDLTDFIENALYDPAFVHDDPRSTTKVFQPTRRDLTYSKYRPDLAALKATDGRMISGLPVDNDDALSRRDMGLEFLDVTARVSIAGPQWHHNVRGRDRDSYRFTNISPSVVDTHLIVIVEGLEHGVRLANASGITSTGDPYLRVYLADGVLRSGESIVRTLEFTGRRDKGRARYTLQLLSGQGKP
jgi:hypothetical protein